MRGAGVALLVAVVANHSPAGGLAAGGAVTIAALVAMMCHQYGFGAGLGVAYRSAASRWPATGRGRGALAGLAIYAGSHGSVLPALGIQRPPWRLAPAAVLWESTSHVGFGMALETVRRALGGRAG